MYCKHCKKYTTYDLEKKLVACDNLVFDEGTQKVISKKLNPSPCRWVNK